MSSAPTAQPPKIGISACLMGEEVRFNGGHKESRLCSQFLARHLEFVRVCPEVGIGLGTPRPTLRLVGDPAAPRAVGSRDERDVSNALRDYGRQTAERLDDLDGFIFMQKSPSCGLYRVKVYQDNGYPAEGGGRGLFAETFCAARPDLPVEEEGRLCDPVLRENFLTRVYAHAEWRALQAEGLTRRGILEFHARYKYQLMASDPARYRALGRMLGGIGEHHPEELAPRYFSELMKGLSRCATRGTHSNVLQHLSGYLKDALSREEKAEMQALIDKYRAGIVPLVVPMTLLKHHFARHPHPYIAQQAYLQPHPEDLSLRNAI
ncbi:YbgA family protein [Metapseudomonas otitidis]|uniref:YbgA family protein n=1 Tax=Metapseudomonas otitidis TaxID=319939 RepID=UPI001F1998CC|nr:2-thiouracil desulfurase family protein [Pseudomonas otitidis]